MKPKEIVGYNIFYKDIKVANYSTYITKNPNLLLNWDPINGHEIEPYGYAENGDRWTSERENLEKFYQRIKNQHDISKCC